jgi:hypothetical protein
MKKHLVAVAALAVACGSGTTNPDGGSSTTLYTIGGTVSTGSAGLVLNTGLEPNLTIPANATTFTFANGLQTGTAYNVTIITQPSGANCTVTDGVGVVEMANVMSVQVHCTIELP